MMPMHCRRRSVRWSSAPVRPYRPSLEFLEEIVLLTITPIDTNYSTGSYADASAVDQLKTSSQDYPNALQPTISVSPLASAAYSDDSGADTGGTAITSFALEVSTDGGPFVVVDSVIPAQAEPGGLFGGSTSFPGQFGHTYRFYSVATDSAGNVEYTDGTAQATVVVPPASTVITVSGSGILAGTAVLTAAVTSGGLPLANVAVGFTLTNGSTILSVGSAVTNASGVATLSNVSLAGFDAGNFPGAVGAVFAADATYGGATAKGDLTVKQANVLPSPTPTRTVVVRERPYFQRKLNGKGKPIGKSVLAGFTFDFGVALDTSAADSARYQLDTTTTRKIKGKKVTILHPITNFSVTYLAASDAVQIKLGSRQAFATGGQVTILSGLTTALGGQLTGPAVFNIAKGGKSVVPT